MDFCIHPIPRRFDKYISSKEHQHCEEVNILADASEVEIVEKAIKVANAVAFARDISNERWVATWIIMVQVSRPQVANPAFYEQQARKIADLSSNMSITVLQKDQLEELVWSSFV